MPKREVTQFSKDSDTQNKILDTAAKLFALKGFKAVTLKEIAEAVGIKIASIYYYYEDKDALIEDVLSRFEGVYKEYHNWMRKANEQVDSLDEAINILFNRDLLDKLNPISRFGMSMTLKEQHSHASAYKFAFKHIYEGSIQNVKECFDKLIEKEIIPPSDTKTLATLFMFCVISGNEMHMHEFADNEAPIDTTEVYIGLKKLITAALALGILKPD